MLGRVHCCDADAGFGERRIKKYPNSEFGGRGTRLDVLISPAGEPSRPPNRRFSAENHDPEGRLFARGRVNVHVSRSALLVLDEFLAFRAVDTRGAHITRPSLGKRSVWTNVFRLSAAIADRVCDWARHYATTRRNDRRFHPCTALTS